MTGAPRLSERTALMALTCGLLMLGATRLAMRVPESVEIPLATYVPGMQPMALEIPGRPYLTTRGVVQVHQVDLEIGRPEEMLAHQSIRLLVGTHDTFPKLLSAELAVVGSGCRYRTAPGARFPNNDVLTLTRSDGCLERKALPKGDLVLTVRYTGDARVALWTYTQPAGIGNNGIIHLKGPISPEFPHQPSVRGSFIDEYRSSGVRVIDLLRHIWQFEDRSWQLTALLACGGVAILVAVLLCPLGPLPPQARAADVGRAAIAAGLMAGGLSLLFAIVVPPFQAPDEPNHFLGFMSLGGRGAERPQVDQWARIGHFNQLRFNGAERYRPVDAREPQDSTWTDASPSDFERRSSTTVAWRTVGRLTRGLPPQAAFLALRVTHALLFGLAMAAASALFVVGAQAGLRHRLFIPLLLVPTLPFFGMHVSNHAFLASAYVLVAAGVVLAFLGGARASTSGLLLGAGMALGLVAGRSSLPLLPLVAAAALTRLLEAAGPSRDRFRRAALFWAGLSVSLVALHLLRVDLPQTRVNELVAGLSGPARLLRLLIDWPAAAGFVVCCAGALAEWTMARPPEAWRGGRLDELARGAAVLAAAMLCVVLAGSVWMDYPHVATVDLLHRPPAGRYLQSVLETAATPRLRDADLLMTTSFWGGFGWLDRLLPGWAIALYTALTALGLIVLLSIIARTRDTVLFVRGLLIFLGAIGSLAAYAVGTLRYSPDIHGRYLLGLYLAGLGLCGSPILIDRDTTPGSQRAARRTSVLLGALLGMYGAVFWFVVGRYF